MSSSNAHPYYSTWNHTFTAWTAAWLENLPAEEMFQHHFVHAVLNYFGPLSVDNIWTVLVACFGWPDDLAWKASVQHVLSRSPDFFLDPSTIDGQWWLTGSTKGMEHAPRPPAVYPEPKQVSSVTDELDAFDGVDTSTMDAPTKLLAINNVSENAFAGILEISYLQNEDFYQQVMQQAAPKVPTNSRPTVQFTDALEKALLNEYFNFK